MEHAGPIALFAACLVSGIVVPLPEDVAVLVAGWQMRLGTLPLGQGFAAAYLGTLARDVLAFGLGRLFARGALAWPRLSRLVSSRRAERLRARLEERGDLLLFSTRFLVGVRAPLYFAGGAVGHPFARFVALDLAGLLLSTPLLLALGWWAGPEAATRLTGALAHQRVILGLLVAGAAALWALRWLHRRQPPVA